MYRSLCWLSGIPLDILEEWLYCWCGELRMLAQTMGRNVILPDQESMVNGIGIAYKFLAGKLRSQGVAIPDPHSAHMNCSMTGPPAALWLQPL